MKLLVLAGLLTTIANAQIAPRPFQHYFVPLPEDVVYSQTFKTIHSTATRGPMNTMTAIAISSDNTVIWYDHWEDGYEQSIGNPQNATTRVWGDEDASNGCAPSVTSCTDANDILTAGQSILLEDVVAVPRIASDLKYDGGDQLASSFPVAITRAEFPDQPGSLLAGGVEVLDMSQWGTEFVAPLGEDFTLVQLRDSCQYVGMYMQAGFEGAILTLEDGSQVQLGRGQTHVIRVNSGTRVVSSNPIQVYILAGDIGSTYEMRWYSLMSVDKWSNEYLSPVGDTIAQSRVFAYNPNDFAITVNYDLWHLDQRKLRSITVPAKGIQTTGWIPDNSSTKLWTDNSNHKFFAVGNTDTKSSTAGQIFDWGFPLMPTDRLSSQVLIGWGYGCTNNNCLQSTSISMTSRSFVFISPVDDATLHIDYDNDGVIDETKNVPRTQGTQLEDTDDTDMTGAVIYATKMNTALGPNAEFVNIAAAWGQWGRKSGSNDHAAQDLGTVVVPFHAVDVSSRGEVVGGGLCQTGSNVMFAVRIANVGPTDVAPNQVSVIQALPPGVQYVPGSTKYVDSSGETSVPDVNGGFPLIGGKTNLRMIPKRGGAAEFTFEVTNDSEDAQVISNLGQVEHVNAVPIQYSGEVTCVTGFTSFLPPAGFQTSECA